MPRDREASLLRKKASSATAAMSALSAKAQATSLLRNGRPLLPVDENCESEGEEGEGPSERAFPRGDSHGGKEDGAGPTSIACEEVGSSTDAAPFLHWAVAGAFHVALRYALHYCGPALSPSELWVWRSLLQLFQRRGSDGVEDGARDDSGTDGVGDEVQWRCSDEVELLLRLSLRKPACFTVKSLENDYGESLHVRAALRALEEVELVHWREDGDGSAALPLAAPAAPSAGYAGSEERKGGGFSLSAPEPTRAEEGAAPRLPETPSRRASRKRRRREVVASPLVVRRSGRHIASLTLRLTPKPTAAAAASPLDNGSVNAGPTAVERGLSSALGGEQPQRKQRRVDLDPKRRAAMERELLQALHATRCVDLRKCAVALHRCCTAHHQQRCQQQQQPPEPPGPPLPPRPSQESSGKGNDEGSNSSLVVLLTPSAARDGAKPLDQQQTDAKGVNGNLCNANAESNDDDKGRGTTAVPSSKHELLLYLVERRYLRVVNHGPTEQRGDPRTTPLLVEITEEHERDLFAQCWDAFIGDYVTVEPAVKSGVATVAELFQLLTGNFGAGGVLTTMQQQPMAPMFVAKAPTALFLGQQLRLLAGFMHYTIAGTAWGLQDPRHSTAAPPASAGDRQGSCVAVAPRWWWRVLAQQQRQKHLPSVSPSHASPAVTASLSNTHCVNLVLFHHADSLSEYRRALEVHRALYEVTFGATTAAQKLRAKDAEFLTSVYRTITDELVMLRKESTRRAHDQIRAASLAFNDGSGGTERCCVPNVHSVLLSNGLRAQQLLQFTPTYRWYACLELLYPLLQSAHLFEQANTCLTYLCEIPVYKVYPRVPTTEGAERTDQGSAPPSLQPYFPIFYRPQKRGSWLLRLAQNTVHLNRKEAALQMLERVHKRWCDALEAHERDPSLHTTVTAIVGGSHSERDDGGRGAAATTTRRACRQSELLRRLPAFLQRRCRLLRAIWPDKADDACDGDARRRNEESDLRQPPSLALYHACVEHQTSSYLRRADVLAVERTLCSLHKSLRRWTPLPQRHQTLTSRMQGARELHIRGERDVMDPQLWREPGLRKVPAMRVEEFVMEHVLHGLNAKHTKEETETGRKRRGDDDDDAGDGEEEKPGLWRGLHCEGAWIAYAARVLLWDAYSYPVVSRSAAAAATEQRAGTAAAVSDSTEDNEDEDDGLGRFLWLTPFQEGPLDLLVPMMFTAHRRRLIEERIAFFEDNPKSVMLRYAAKHMGGKGALPRSPAGPPPSKAPLVSSTDLALAVTGEATTEEEEAAMSMDEEEEGWPVGERRREEALSGNSKAESAAPSRDDRRSAAAARSEAQPAGQQHAGLSVAQRVSSVVGGAETSKWRFFRSAEDGAFSDGISPDAAVPPELRVFVGDFPLLDLLNAVPQGPLLKLLRCWYLSDPAEGHSVKFSGFPDLVLWRRGPANPLLSPDNEHEDPSEEAGEGAAARARPIGFPESDSFRLIEVKSPHDVLSTKQIAVNDCLRRCGFDVSVAHVLDVAAEEAEKERPKPRKGKQSMGGSGRSSLLKA